ncbi:sacsin-like [Melanotaenia boesemani]|uniref:sacsin-like n=1 Tax=Melanotaenia boesemani TaxID=1250792 RepID=UPI001C041855|nr:sacsin-like [Melanotaenia boesemani]
MSEKTKKKARTTFGATAPPFLDYLRDILRRYPDGGQILKELIQNADDAQATEVVFIHDERSYQTESLWTNELGKYQGPALYTYNNAVFTDDDWDRIQKAGRSGKINDPNKIGRFGIGFNSVYHITDVPSIFSSGHLGLMDPQEKIFGERNGGFLWSLNDPEHQEALMTMRDQFQPFRDIVSLVGKQEWSKVVEEDQYFNGTIFRFPLRNEKSEISDNLYDSKKVTELFDSFIADADLSLLFLKNVTSVSLIRISADGTVHKRLEVKSSDPTGVIVKSANESVIKSLTRFKQITLDSEDHRETKWLITTCTMKEGKVKDLDVLSKKLSFIPHVDLAFPCGEERHGSEGRLSCFLPLPNNESNKTGLPVYVNACFGLTDNRRDIKWQEEEQRHDEHALWNELLVKEVLPQAYLKIIQDAIKLSQQSSLPVSSVYNLWPDITQLQHRNKWRDVALDVFHHLFKQNLAILSLAKDERKFIPLSEALLPCNGPTSPDIISAIRRTLVSCGENLVTLSASVAKAIEATPHQSAPKRVTPTALRRILHKTGVQSITKDDKLCLLEYILSDGEYKELKGLQLLPLSDGTFRSFTDREEDTALIDSEEFPRELLPYCKHLFIAQKLSPACTAHLKQLARKNLFRVINIDKACVAEYTRKYLPQNWKLTGTTLVRWDSSNTQHPPSDWFQKFWKFLNTHFSELRDFIDIPLIPVSSLSVGQPVTVAKLQQNTTLIFQSRKEKSLPDQIAQLVTKVGGTVVRGNEWIKHEDLDTYVLSPSPESVMKVLKNLDSKCVIRDLKSESHKAHEVLKDYLSLQSSLSDIEKDLLLMLPLFQTMRGSSVAARSKQAVLLTSDPTIPTELPMPDSLIQCVTEADRRLLKLLKVNLLGPAEAAVVLIDGIETGTCSKEETEKIMTWILQHGNILFSQNQSLKDRCRNLSFIEVNGKKKMTSCFFDPRIQTFKVIFEPVFFPPPVYTKTPQMLESLTDLGLKNKEADISPEQFLHVSTQIDKLHVHSHTQALKMAQVLLEILDAKDLQSKFSNEQLTHLWKLKWIPGDQAGNDKGQFRDKSQGSCFYCPDEMRHIMYHDVVGHVMPVTGKLSNKLNNKLGLKRLPPPEKVIENLSVLKSKAQEMADPDTNIGFKRSLHSIYRHMQENISTFTAMMNKETDWLWAHNHFVSPHNLVLDYPHDLDLSSYIGKVPKEFLPYKELLREFGLKKTPSSEEIVDILYSIQNNIQRRQEAFAGPAEVKVSIEILNWLWREKKTVQDDTPVPVIIENGLFTLKPRSEALLWDVSKTGQKDLHFSQDNMYILHEEIPIATAEWLEIQFLSNYILAPELVGIEECGQSEPITMRIKNILREYDEETDIFKELLQNAEDAGADECKFMVDFREHKEKPDRLIDPEMAICQGPCLWAFNNEQFSAEDWENIVRVGSASKENKVEKIGKFGLGFNTVYHVTDVPSILSGNRLLILDPNVTHLKKHIKHKTNPGIRLDLSQKRLFDFFPGQFAPYESIFDCNFTRKSPPEPYAGTLIKLPFRREEEAQNSEISTKVYHKRDIIALQQNFTINPQSHLLFLKNINTLSLQSISDNGSTPPRDDEIKTILTVSKTVVGTIKIQDETSLSKQHQAEKALIKLDGKCKEIIDSDTVNIVRLTSKQSGESEQQFWLLYNCFGTDQSLNMSLQENKKSRFSLPIGGVAVPLKTNPESQKLSPLQTDLVGQAFCFLPLPIHTGLPVNVNGTFAVMSNRKGLWESGEKSDWNKALLQDPLVTAYVTALLALKEMSENNHLEDYCYHSFWPDREKVSNTFKPLVDAFYSAIAQHSNGPELLSDGKDWCSMDNAIFLHESIEKDKDISTLAAQVCKKYAKASNCVVPLPLWLRNGFKQAGLETVLKNKTWNWKKLYQEVVFKNLKIMDPKSRDTLILHAIDLNIKEIDDLLLSYPCIPTTNGQLQYINKLVKPSGGVACLFEGEEGRLLGGTKNGFNSPRSIKRLLDLGMANDDLPLEDITKKAGTVNEIWRADEEKAYRCLKCLLELMRNHMNDQDTLHWETLRRTAFLPAFSPGDIKMERKKTLQMPTAVFSDKFSLLVNMTHPVLDHTGLKIHNTDPLLEVLGVCSSLDPNTVLQQLQEACEKSQSIDIPTLNKIANECYSCLDQRISGCMDTTFISQKANSFPFILVGDTFVNVSCVAENGQFEAKPYLHILPLAFTSFRNLWESVGVKREFTINQFLTVLQELHSKHENKPLPHSDLSTCLTILNKGIFEAKQETTDDFLIPNVHGVLQPARELVYNDSPWMPVSSGVTLCHASISRALACHLGIKTTRHHSLENYKDDISPFAFEFEQHEELSVRIKGIISAYPSKKDILKELIQNADDGEATEIHFVWDKRQHRKEKTFGERWNRLQGPALCVFNNKVFSNDDLTGIQQLGEGGKQNSAGKIGKYGVGFNSVYHLTDCPSILTGDKLLCISDPNKEYIDCHSDKRPSGMGYKLPDSFKEMYMDVYKSFLPDKFPLKEGTMFRLPLRTSANGKISKISHEEVTDGDMRELCSALSEDPEGLMLFLKNICKIKIHEINEHSGKLQTIFEVEKNLPEGSQEVKDGFVKCLQDALKSETLFTPKKVFYETTISTSDKRQSKWIIAEQFGSFKDNDDIKLSNKLPQGAIAARVSIKTNLSQSNKMDFKGAAFCSLPLPGETGLPVHVNGNFEVDASRKNLWKEDGQSHRSNWNEFLKKNIIAPLYADLLHHIRCKIPVKTVPRGDFESCFNNLYLCFWPTASKIVGPEWHEMIHEVYRSMKEKGLDVIPVLRSSKRKISHLEIREFFFDWCNISKTETTEVPYLIHSAFDEINPILEDIGMKLVPTSTCMKKIWKNIKAAGIDVKEVDPAAVRNFLKEKPLNDPTQTDEDLPLPITATLIRDQTRCSQLLNFCLKDFSLNKDIEQNPNSLNGLPLLLTRDQVLRAFNSESPKFISGYDSLFDGYEDKFADHGTNKDHIKHLQTCNLVKNLTLTHAAEPLKPLVQSRLQNCEHDPDSGLHVLDETMLKWLESLWKFIWSEMKFKSSSDDEQSLTFSDVKELLSDFCILPVVGPNSEHFLQTMKNMSSVVPHTSNKEIPEILIKLGFMKHDGNFFSKIDRQLYLLLHPELMDVNDINSVLDLIYNINRSRFSRLSSEDMKRLQNFLQSEASTSKNNPEYEKKLKSLPLFETMNGTRVRIDGPVEVFVLDTNYSGRFPDLFTLPNINCILLKCNPENQTLAELLNITVLDDLEYFMRFLLPIVHMLTEKQSFHCLKLLLLLRHHSNFHKFKDDIENMKTVKLIRSSQGRLETASYYFDDGVQLYRRMVPKEKFVPETFWSELCDGNKDATEDAKKLIRELGMKHEVSKDDIIKFAYQLESEAKGNDKLEELKQKSALLLRAALNKASNDKDGTLLRNIADIRFIFPEKIREELCNYHQPFATERDTVTIRGSLINRDQKNQDLIWSSMPIIHLPFSTSNVLLMMKDAGAHEQPPPHCVTSNMRNICHSPCKTEELIKTRADVFRGSYAYLQAKGFDGQSLAGLPVVLVEEDTQLVKPENVCLSLHNDLDFRPYLYQTPPQDAVYAEFFRKVGIKNAATAVQYCNVLADVYADSCDKPQMNPNQLKAVKRAVEQLFQLMKAQENQILNDDVKTLYLPAVDGKLHPSHSLYYNNTVFETKRMEEALENQFLLLEKLSNCHLDNDIYEQHRLVQLLPQKFQPQMLSEITQEGMVESQLCKLGTSCDFSGWFNKHLSSRAFRHGLICLLREQSQGKTTQEEAEKMCEKTFGSIHIVCCNTLKTMLWLNKEPLHKTTRETHVFVKRDQQGCTFYLQHNHDMVPKVINKVNMTLTKEMNTLLEHRMSSAHLLVLGQLLMCDDLEDVLKTLAENEIRDTAETECLILSPPAPGRDIPVEWHDSLDMSFLNNFEEGEYVGYSTNNKYIYAIVVEELPGSCGRYSWRYNIEIGEDELVQVSHLDLYQFKREKKLKQEGETFAYSMDLMLLAGSPPHSSKPSKSSLPASFNEVKKEIDKCLSEIWSLPEEERQKGIKRLYLRWHPDKNPDCQSFATEAFKYLLNHINELTKGKNVRPSHSSHSSRYYDFSDFFHQWNQEAMYHRSNRERFSRGYRSYNFWSYNTNVPRPNKEEAQRWYKQARCDLDAAQKDTDGGSTEWCLFKVHQAVEKALIAAEYKRNGQRPTSSSISAIAEKVSHYRPLLRDLPQIVEHLVTLGVDAKKTQYPNYHPVPHIPNGQFRSEKGMLALNKASELLSKVERYVN